MDKFWDDPVIASYKQLRDECFGTIAPIDAALRPQIDALHSLSDAIGVSPTGSVVEEHNRAMNSLSSDLLGSSVSSITDILNDQRSNLFDSTIGSSFDGLVSDSKKYIEDFYKTMDRFTDIDELIYNSGSLFPVESGALGVLNSSDVLEELADLGVGFSLKNIKSQEYEFVTKSLNENLLGDSVANFLGNVNDQFVDFSGATLGLDSDALAGVTNKFTADVSAVASIGIDIDKILRESRPLLPVEVPALPVFDSHAMFNGLACSEDSYFLSNILTKEYGCLANSIDSGFLGRSIADSLNTINMPVGGLYDASLRLDSNPLVGLTSKYAVDISAVASIGIEFDQVLREARSFMPIETSAPQILGSHDVLDQLSDLSLGLPIGLPFESDISAQMCGNVAGLHKLTDFAEKVSADSWLPMGLGQGLRLGASVLDRPTEDFYCYSNETSVQIPNLPVPLVARFVPAVGRNRGQSHFESITPIENREGYDAICTVEMALRSLIVQELTNAFGDSWLKHRIDGAMVAKWKERQAEAREAGEPDRLLIEYADFMDCVHIICRRDNWDKVFQKIFRNKASLQESLRRLHGPRKQVMHSRRIDDVDVYLIKAEVTRLMIVIETSLKIH